MKHLSLLLIVGVLTALLAGCARSDFNAQADLPIITQALEAAGLQICAQDDLNWNVTPGFVEGKHYDVATDCAAYDANKPGARIHIARFDSADARDAALRNFETTYRRHPGGGIGRAVGPWLILVDGNQSVAAVTRLRAALAQLSVQ
jgi:hypothetical protein